MMTNELFKDIGAIRTKLYLGGFYEGDRLEQLVSLIKELNSYISSYSIDHINKHIQLQIRKVGLKKIDEPDDSLSFYPVFNQAIINFFNINIELIKEIFKEDFQQAYTYLMNNTSMLYTISRGGVGSVFLFL